MYPGFQNSSTLSSRSVVGKTYPTEGGICVCTSEPLIQIDGTLQNGWRHGVLGPSGSPLFEPNTSILRMRVTIAGTCTVQAYARIGPDRAQCRLTGIDSYAGQIAGSVVD
jgi:hypothetical protein